MPRPYILEPESAETEIAAGETLRFDMKLLGRAISHAPLVVTAIAIAGETGVTAKRSRYEVAGVEIGETLQLDLLPQAPLGKAVTLELVSPTRVKFADRLLTDDLPFPALVQAVVLRVSMLAAAHGAAPWKADARAISDTALDIATKGSDVRWQPLLRRSSRTGRVDTLGGLVGRLTYEGDLAPFAPLLRWGEIVHVGKKATFGLGRYRLHAP